MDANRKRKQVANNVLAINALKPKAERYELPIDGCRGLYVRIFPSGHKVFRYRFGQDGRVGWLTLKAKTLADARAEWEAARQRNRDGDDLQEQRKQQRALKQLKRQTERSVPTIAILAERYMRDHALTKKRSWAEDERRLNKHVLPRWGQIKVKAIRRADVVDLIDDIASTAPIEANRVLALVRKLFSFAVDKALIEAHPCLRLRAPGQEQKRSRALLTDAELVHFWGLTREGGDLPSAVAAALRLMVLTGCRASEVLGMERRELDLDRAEWLIPAERFKGKRQHLVPLTATVMEIIRSRTSDARYVFPRANSDGAMDAHFTGKHLRRAFAAKREIESFTQHDLRRTVESGLARLGIHKEIRDHVLGHKDSSVGGQHYNCHDFLAEKRRALATWESELLRAATAASESKLLMMKPCKKSGMSR